MKARRVKRLDAAAPLAECARRIIRTRLRELVKLADAAATDDDPKTLHDARIAAKRLRYVLDVTGFCLGGQADELCAQAREIQDLLGEVHDCDMLMPRVIEHIEAIRDEDTCVIREALAPGGVPAVKDVEWSHISMAPNRRAYSGLEKLALLLQARRELQYVRFLALWKELRRDGIAVGIDDAPEGAA